MTKKSHDLAMEKYEEGVQSCASELEISEFSQMILTLAAKMIHGIEGKSFKKDFMRAAIKDDEKITLKKAVSH
jgi:hypothetical protein